MDENVRLSKINLEYSVRGGPDKILAFLEKLVARIRTEQNNIRVMNISANYDMFTGITGVSLEIVPGEEKERQLRMALRDLEEDPKTPTENVLWSLWKRDEHGNYVLYWTDHREKLCKMAEEYADYTWGKGKWEWYVDPRKRPHDIGQLSRKPQYRPGSNAVDLLLRKGTELVGEE